MAEIFILKITTKEKADASSGDRMHSIPSSRNRILYIHTNSSTYTLTLKMEVAFISETSATSPITTVLQPKNRININN
jgi:hypothetical protein